MKIAIAGTGYVGIVTAACLAEKGHTVICVDIDETRINDLRKLNQASIYENGLDHLLIKNKKNISYTVDHRVAYTNTDVIFIAVGTPEKKDGAANLKYVYSAVKQIGENLRNDCVVVVKSTVPIGTNDKIERMFSKYTKFKVHVVSNPEFLAQGTAVQDTLYASRIVIGVEDEYAKSIMLELYDAFDAPKLITNRKSAEMIKYASNGFLALKISYINEIANLCELIGADIEDVTKGMGYDERIGAKFLKAGIGYGGACFPKDTKALHWLSNFHDHEIKTIKSAIEVNENQKLKLIKKAKKYYDSFEGLTIAVLGLSFKPGTDDLREAPSVVNVPIFLEDGAKVKVYDPVAMKNFHKIFGETVFYAKSIDEAIEKADICFIFTEWQEIVEYNLANFVERMRKTIILDGRNCYALSNVKKYNVCYESIGRP